MHLGSEFNNQAGSSMQVDRGSWMSGPPESSTVPQLSGPPPLGPGQIGPGSQPPRQAPVRYLLLLILDLSRSFCL